MDNPFAHLEARLNTIETLVLEIRDRAPQAIPEPEADKLLGVREAAEFLSLTVPTIYSKVSKGELPVMKRGKRLYFSKAELLAYLREGRRRTNSEILALPFPDRKGKR